MTGGPPGLGDDTAKSCTYLTVADNGNDPSHQKAKGESARTLFIAVIGAPNAGKSTLVNRIVGTKVSVVSHKVQTTRARVRGIARVDQIQLVFIDTPGIFTPRRRLERAMVQAAWEGAVGAEEIVLLVDAKTGVTEEVMGIVTALQNKKRRAILALNKIDLIRYPNLLELAATLNVRGAFTETFMISAETGSGVADLVTLLARRAPVEPWLFPDGTLSDMSMQLLAAEITREKIFIQLHKEIPYSTMVLTNRWEELIDGSVRIDQTIIVLRETQRIIMLGKGGSRIKSIGWAARQELEEALERRVHLFLYVKVDEHWLESRSYYHEWSLNFDA